MGIVGGALIPQVYVHLKQYVDFQWAFLGVMAPCYLYILYYGLVGHRAGQARG
jgi:fucose permease